MTSKKMSQTKRAERGERLYNHNNIYSSLSAAADVNTTAHTACLMFPTKYKMGNCGLQCRRESEKRTPAAWCTCTLLSLRLLLCTGTLCITMLHQYNHRLTSQVKRSVSHSTVWPQLHIWSEWQRHLTYCQMPFNLCLPNLTNQTSDLIVVRQMAAYVSVCCNPSVADRAHAVHFQFSSTLENTSGNTQPGVYSQCDYFSAPVSTLYISTK